MDAFRLQVLPDWKKKRPGTGRAADPKVARAGVASMLQAFMMEKEDQTANQGRLGKKDTSRVANAWLLVCLSHGLKGGTGITLDRFLVDSPVRALAEDERRYYVDCEPDDGTHQPGDPPRRRRNASRIKHAGRPGTSFQKCG